MYVVAGVTGHTGRVVAEQLLSAELPLRVIVRDAAKGAEFAARGAEVAVADLGDASALAQALDGAEAAYLLCPPDSAASDFLADRRRIVDSVARAVEASWLPRLVWLSAKGAHLPSGTGPIRVSHHAEQALAFHQNVSFVRAASFVENWLSALPFVRAEGRLPVFQDPDRKIAMVSTADIGRIAVEALLDEEQPRFLELAGDDDASPRDVAGWLGERLGRPVEVMHLGPAAAAQAMVRAGMSADLSRLYAEMFTAVDAGLVQWEHPETVRRGYRTVAEALEEILG